MKNLQNYYESKEALQRALNTGIDHTSANILHYRARKELTGKEAATIIYDTLYKMAIERDKLPTHHSFLLCDFMDELQTLIDND